MISAMPDIEEEGGAKLIRVPIGFPAELHEWLRELAFRRRTAMAEIVREAVREYRDRHDPQLGLPLGRAEEERYRRTDVRFECD